MEPNMHCLQYSFILLLIQVFIEYNTYLKLILVLAFIISTSMTPFSAPQLGDGVWSQMAKFLLAYCDCFRII